MEHPEDAKIETQNRELRQELHWAIEQVQNREILRLRIVRNEILLKA